MDHFNDKMLYPQDENKSFLEHFDGLYSTVYLSLFPFFIIKDKDFEKYDFKKSVEITFEQARKQDDIFEKLEESNATIYTTNIDYPSDEEILNQGIIVPWLDVRNGAGLSSDSDLYKALKTSIGAYNKDYSRPDLAKKLEQFTKVAQVWEPGEGQYDILTLRKIYNSFKSLGIRHIIVVDEFFVTRKELMLDQIALEKFTEEIGGKDYYIYSADKSILFSLDWDSFFFIICYSSASTGKIIDAQNFEGFFANSATTHGWELN
jgi:hypothetical protein